MDTKVAGSLGGTSTKNKYGADHFKRMKKLSDESKKRKKLLAKQG